MDLKLEPHPEGCVLELKAQPGSRKTELRGVQNGALKVCVTDVAEKGKANKAILQFLRKTLQVRGSQLEIIAGETASQKRLLVRECTPEELIARLRACGVENC